jgi:CheY-like chemotaxis protein
MAYKKIVIIDDEKDLCFLIRNILEETGQFRIFEAYEGEAGVRLCVEERPALILLDYVMPGVKGDQIIRKLRNLDCTKLIPIVLMSGLGEMVFFEDIGLYDWLTGGQGNEKKPDGSDCEIEWDKMPEFIARKMNVDYYIAKPFVADRLVKTVERFVLDVPLKQNQGLKTD